MFPRRYIDFTDCKEAPENDTELTQNGIEFVARIIQKTPATLLAGISPEHIEFFFVFTLKVLIGKEPLPKAAAADFWVCVHSHGHCNLGIASMTLTSPRTDNFCWSQK